MTPEYWGLSINDVDHLAIAQWDLVELAREHGTPLHVINEERLIDNYRRFSDAFSGWFPGVTCHYSYKTNCVPGILRRLHNAGCGAEVVSRYELWLALQLGVPPAQIIYNGTLKTRDDLIAAIDAGVGSVNIDSPEEFHLLCELAENRNRPVDIGIRIYPGHGWRGQFGLEAKTNEVIELCNSLAPRHLCRISSLHAHAASAQRSTGLYRDITTVLCRLAQRIQRETSSSIDCIDIGGGFGTPTVKTYSIPEVARYKLFNRPPQPPDTDSCPTFEEFATDVYDAMRSAYSGDPGSRGAPDLIVEPGRAITGSAQTLLITVHGLKKRANGSVYAITDGGMQNIAFPLSYEYHHCFVANHARKRPDQRYYVTGPLCSPEDILYRNWRLPEIAVGEVLAIMDTGAYFTSFSNNFSFPRPPIILVSNSGTEVIRRRETFEHLTAMDKEYWQIQKQEDLTNQPGAQSTKNPGSSA